MIELLLVMVILGVLVAALAPSVQLIRQGWESGERRLEVLQNARVGMEEVTRQLRGLKRVSAVSGPTDTAGYIEYYDPDNVLMRFRFNSGTGNVDYGPSGAESSLVGPVSSLTFVCRDAAGAQLAAPVNGSIVQSVEVSLTVTDSAGKVPALAMASKVFVRTLAPGGVVINEIMYRPNGDIRTEEWLELYNPVDAVDLAGWQLLSIDSAGVPDTISADTQYGTGSSLLPSGGYAVITTQSPTIDTQLLANPSFETGAMGSWIQAPTAWTRINDGDAHDGNRKLGRTNAGTVYQSVAIPAGAVSAWFYCWEKTPSAPASTRLVITVCNTAGVVLDTLYDGPMGAAWTRHAADLTAHVGNTRWIYFQNMNATTCWIDDISVTWSYVSNSAVRLCVNDTTLAGRLRNTTDTVTLLSGNTIVDAVTYQSAWGGNNNDRTLERIRTLEDSMAPANWAEGPLNGTAGRINQAYLP